MKDNSKEKSNVIRIPKKNKMIDEYNMICPICGEIVGEWERCENCQWINSGEVNVDGGSMEMTLVEAVKAYREGKPIY